MKPTIALFVVLSALAVFLAGQERSIPKQQLLARTLESREVSKELGQSLKAELVSAMRDQGPLEAIAVCQREAGALTASLSRETGWEVRRTSLKARNTRPDDWEAKVLAEFDKRVAAGEDPAHMEHAEVVKVDGQPRFRYMKAIPTSEACLACHGEHIAPPMEAKIATLYPQDAARGFRVGDVRGAFSVSQPIN